MSIIPALGKMRQEDHTFFNLAWTTQQDFVSKNKTDWGLAQWKSSYMSLRKEGKNRQRKKRGRKRDRNK